LRIVTRVLLWSQQTDGDPAIEPAEQFLSEWIASNRNSRPAPASRDEAEVVADSCITEAAENGITEPALRGAAGGDLVGVILDEMKNDP
jgi:hypothetical protein